MFHQEFFNGSPTKRPLSLSWQHAQNPIRLGRAVSPLEPVQSVLRVAEVPIHRPVTQLEHDLHRCALAAPMAPRVCKAVEGARSDKHCLESARYFQLFENGCHPEHVSVSHPDRRVSSGGACTKFV